jgi:pimeloyl-ACP methyl ester carboxylesterase
MNPNETQMQHLDLFAETLRLGFTDQGEGRPFLLLHGGAGPNSMRGLAAALAKTGRAILPTHPGFDGAPRPEKFSRIEDLVLAYLALIERRALSNVIVVGNSMGGHIAAEMALLSSPRIAGIVLLNAVGIDTGSPEKTIVDPTKIPPQERAAYAFHDPKKFAFAPPSPEALAVMAENQRVLRVYAGEKLFDPTLHARLAKLATPTLVAWGQSDRIVDADYGRRFANAIPNARFELVSEAGHFPQMERLDETVRLIDDFTKSL